MASRWDPRGWNDEDWKRAALAAGTMGMSEAGGLRTVIDQPGDGGSAFGIPALGDMPVIGTLADGAKDMLTADKAQAYTPTQSTAAYGDPTYSRNHATEVEVKGNALESRALDAQNRGIDTYDANRARVDQNLDAEWFRDFAEQGPGPSVAQAQLKEAQDANMRQALAFAGSGRGNMGANAALGAASQQRADAQTQTAGQAATLAAQEADMWKQRQVQAQQAAADITTSIRTLDLDTLNTLVQNKQVNDAFSVALGEQGLTADQIVQRYAEMDAQQRLEFEKMMGDYFMRAQEANVQSDASRDAAYIAALGGVAEAGLGFAGQAARAAGDAVPL